MIVKSSERDYPEGMMSYNESRWLETLASSIQPPGLLVEVGSWKGCSTVALGRGAQKSGSRVVAIDWGKGSLKDWDHPGFGKAWNYWTELQANLVTYGVHDVVTVVKKDSLAALRKWSFGEIALLFLDGEHNADQVERELRGFRPYLRPGAILALHDYLSFPGVGQGLGKVFGMKELVYWGMVDHLAAFQLASSPTQEDCPSRRSPGLERTQGEVMA